MNRLTSPRDNAQRASSAQETAPVQQTSARRSSDSSSESSVAPNSMEALRVALKQIDVKPKRRATIAAVLSCCETDSPGDLVRTLWSDCTNSGKKRPGGKPTLRPPTVLGLVKRLSQAGGDRVQASRLAVLAFLCLTRRGALDSKSIGLLKVLSAALPERFPDEFRPYAMLILASMKDCVELWPDQEACTDIRERMGEYQRQLDPLDLIAQADDGRALLSERHRQTQHKRVLQEGAGRPGVARRESGGATHDRSVDQPPAKRVAGIGAPLHQQHQQHQQHPQHPLDPLHPLHPLHQQPNLAQAPVFGGTMPWTGGASGQAAGPFPTPMRRTDGVPHAVWPSTPMNPPMNPWVSAPPMGWQTLHPEAVHMPGQFLPGSFETGSLASTGPFGPHPRLATPFQYVQYSPRNTINMFNMPTYPNMGTPMPVDPYALHRQAPVLPPQTPLRAIGPTMVPQVAATQPSVALPMQPLSAPLLFPTAVARALALWEEQGVSPAQGAAGHWHRVLPGMGALDWLRHELGNPYAPQPALASLIRDLGKAPSLRAAVTELALGILLSAPATLAPDLQLALAECFDAATAWPASIEPDLAALSGAALQNPSCLNALNSLLERLILR